jgi:hypothetical protein
MKRLVAISLPFLFSLALLACGGDGLTLFPASATAELSIVGPEDGAVLTSAQQVTLQVGATDPTGHADLEVRVTLLSATGESVWEDDLAGTAINEDFHLQLPDLPPGQYRLEIVVLEAGAQVARRVATIFTVRERPRITGIASFPPLIIARSPVLLSADLADGEGTDPWLRWTWRGKTIAQGSASSGTTSVLWTAPADEGVYTVTLELFPAAPAAGTDFPFRSSIVMSTDIYVAAAGAAARDELGPAISYLSLFHLRADLVDAAAAARDLERTAVLIGSPGIVPVGDGFGYRLEDGAGFRASWPILPVADGFLEPFTLSVGIRPEQLSGADRILTTTTGDLALSLRLGTDASPELAIGVSGAPETVVTSSAPSLAPGRRYLVSVSVEPRPDGLAVRWFIDGRQVSESVTGLVLPVTGSGGSAIIGGTTGFTAVIDELGVYYRDDAGRPATDATLLRQALGRQYGDRLLLAEGFDGMFLPVGFTTTGKVALGAGRLALSPEAAVELPPLTVPAEGFTLVLELEGESQRTADVRLAWAGSAEPFLEGRVVAESGALRLEITSDSVTALTPDGVKTWPVPKAPAEKAGIVLRAACPRDARSPLQIAAISALAPDVKD